MVKTLYLIRHGATEGSEIKRYKGSMDLPLSEEGVRQIGRTAGSLCKWIDHSRRPLILFSSPLIRALRSAEIIGERFGIRPVVIPEFRKRSFGIWEGMTFEEIGERYPEEFRAWVENPLLYSPPQGESTMEVRERVMTALKRILEDTVGGEKDLIIVAHGGVNRIILAELLSMPLENIFRIEQDYGAINIIEFQRRYPISSKVTVTSPLSTVTSPLSTVDGDVTVVVRLMNYTG